MPKCVKCDNTMEPCEVAAYGSICENCRYDPLISYPIRQPPRILLLIEKFDRRQRPKHQSKTEDDR